MTRRPSRQARAAQWLLLLAVVAAAWLLASMAGANLARRHIPFGFGYLAGKANFDIPFRLISWSVGDTYFRALVICILNTLLVSALGVVTATLLGFLVGVMRLSNNWLVRNLALGFIELYGTRRNSCRSSFGTSPCCEPCRVRGRASCCRGACC